MSDLFEFPRSADLPSRPQRCILHWTAGRNVASDLDRQHYHILIESRETEAGGEVLRYVAGVPIASNMRQLGPGDEYAAHTRGFNSFSVGVTVCGMLGAVERPFHPGPHPITPLQVKGLVDICVQLAVVYDLAPTEDHFFTHPEAETIHGRPQAGKWDLDRWPHPRTVEWQNENIGPWLRQEMSERIGTDVEDLPPEWSGWSE